MSVVREVPVVLRHRPTNPPGSGGAGPDQGRQGGRWRRWRRLLIGLLVTVLLLGVGALGAGLALQSRLDQQLSRVDGVFAGLENRPQKPTTGTAAKAVNILLMGTDLRSDDPSTGTAAEVEPWVPGAQRTDTIMILHVDGDRQGASLISIPRDAWVSVPGHGRQKINAAFSLAGPDLAVHTVEQLTGVRIDHLAVVDWMGFQALIDTVGGIRVDVAETVEDPLRDVLWVEGRQTLDGPLALLYVRQRYGLPGGDLDRVRRQQAVMRALADESVSVLRSLNPKGIYDLLDTLTRHVTVDSGWSIEEMRDLLVDLRSLRVSSIDFFTAPVAGFGTERGQSVVRLDGAGNAALWESVRDDRVAEWLKSSRADTLTGPVR
ncbi:LCP family protein [Nocardioides sp. GCM10027113]|uniref:LCP family protein n=1 Tax=unclassified Nocardioides TaxID=2615069 RepID=UPI00360E7539